MRISYWSSDVCSSDLHARFSGQTCMATWPPAKCQSNHPTSARVEEILEVPSRFEVWSLACVSRVTAVCCVLCTRSHGRCSTTQRVPDSSHCVCVFGVDAPRKESLATQEGSAVPSLRRF